MKPKNKLSMGRYLNHYFIEILVILVAGIVVYNISHYLNMYEKLHILFREYEYLDIDELFLTVFVISIGLVFFSIRRYLELKREMLISSITKIKLQREINERTEAEQELQNSTEKYRALIEQASNAIYLQEGSSYEVVNKKFLDLFDITIEEVNTPGFSILNYTHPKSLQLLKDRKQKVRAGEKVSGMYEFTAITKNKRVIELEASISYIYSDGKIKTQGILRNITKRKRAENIKTAIYRISEETNLTDNLQELIEKIHLILKSIMCAKNFYVALYDEKTDRYSSPYFVDQYDSIDDKTMNLNGSLTDYVRKTRKAIIVDHKRHAELVESGKAAYILKPPQVWMGVPLKTAAGVFGVIAMQSYEDPKQYSHEDLELLNLISDQIAIAIEKKRASDEKEKNNKFFEIVIDSLAKPLYVINVDDFSVEVANKSARELILNNSNYNFGHCEKLKKGCDESSCSPSPSCQIENILNSKQPVKFEHSIFDDSNNEIMYEVHGFPIFNEKNEIKQIIEYFEDITDRKRVENKLIELASFPEANPNIVLSINSNQEITYMNMATIYILSEIGISKENMNLCLPENLGELIEIMLLEGSGMQNIRVKIENHTLAWSFQPVARQDIIHCYAYDITQQVQQTEQINKLSMVATQSSNIIMITDIEGVVEYINPYYTLVTGYEKEEIIGGKLSVITSGNMPKELYEDLWSTITDGKTWNGKIENKKKNGELYWERKTISPIFNEVGSITSYISIGTDITAELLTQRQLVESEKFSAIATLAAGVAHEFKNYLGGIIGNASFSLDEIDSKDGLSLAKDTLSSIIDMGERANDVAMSLLTFSKAKPDDRNKEDIKKIVTQSIKLIEKELETLSIEVATHFDEVQPLEVSLSKIQQLLLNLFINAKHAIGTNGVITIALLNKEDYVEIRIGDSGGGIEKEPLDKIFDPFYSTKGVWGEDAVSGTGMGLSICRNIAREHKGDLTVDTIIGVGTVFTITLPISTDKSMATINTVKHDNQNVIFFTLNHSIVTKYYNDICNSNLQLLLVDNFHKIDKTILEKTEYVVCDAKFSAKLELYRMVEFCIENGMPYVMVNCGTMEYQLSDLYDNSVANYKEFPDFDKIMRDYESVPVGVKSEQEL